MLYDTNGKTVGEKGLGSTAYEFDYFSGSQIFLMIGDVLIDAAVHINMQVSQNKVFIINRCGCGYRND